MKSLEQIEKNVQASFGYVKKDLMMLNDAISELQEKISKLSSDQATLFEEIKKLKIKIEGKKATKNSKKKQAKKSSSKKSSKKTK